MASGIQPRANSHCRNVSAGRGNGIGRRDPWLTCTDKGRRTRGRLWRSRPLVASFVFALIAGVVATSSAAAQTKAEPAAIVVFELVGSEDTTELRDDLTTAIREQVRGNPRYDLVNDKPVVLSDVVVVLGCESDSTTCLNKAADHFGADYLVFGKLEDVADRTRVSVRLFDPAAGRYVRSFGRVMARLEHPYQAFREQVDEILTTDSQRSVARLRVRSDVKGAQVKLNGEDVGKTPLSRRNMQPGTYHVEVSTEDGRSWSTDVEIEAGGDVRIRAPLNEVTTGTEGERKGGTASSAGTEERSLGETGASGVRDEEKSASWGPWFAIGFGGLALVGSGVEAAVMQSAMNDLEEWRRTNRSPSGECHPEECEMIERGENAELGHRILLGVGGVSVAGGLLWLWLQSGDDGDRAAARRLDVSVGPDRVTIGWEW